MSFFSELKRRNVFKVGVAYIIVAWLLIQVTDIVAPALHLPDWTVTLIIYLLIIGFPMALFLSWAFELTPEGIKATSSEGPDQFHTQTTGQQLNYTIIGVLILFVIFLVVDNYILKEDRSDEIAVRSEAGEARSDETSVRSEASGMRRDVLPNSIAVLAFENLSPDPNNAYFAAGIHEEVLNYLAKIKALNVIARTTMLRYTGSDKSIEEIAGELKVKTVMEGSVRYANNRVRITAQLIDPETGAHLWSEAYERDFDDVFAIQADIAENIANALKAEFSLAEQATLVNRPTTSPEAYSLYLEARSAGTERAHELLDQALKLDPDFATANALKAWLYEQRLTNTTIGNAVSVAERDEIERLIHLYAERAIAKDPTVPFAHTALADIHFVNWRWTEAQRAFEHALEASPNDDQANQYLGFLYSYSGQHEKALSQSERFTALNPQNNNVYVNIASTYAYAGDIERAAETLREGIARSPNAFYYAWLGYMEIALGNNASALKNLQSSEEQMGDNPPTVFLPELAYAYGRLGRSDDARRLFDKISERSAGQEIGLGGWIMSYAAIGDYDQALVLLKQAAEKVANNVIDEGFFNLMNFKMNIMNDPVLKQPEFVAVRDRIAGK